MEREKLNKFVSILESLYSGELSDGLADQVRSWLADDKDAELKAKALEAVFEQRVVIDTAPASDAYRKLESLQKDLGMPVEVTRTPRRRAFLRPMLQVAAALFIVIGTVVFFNGRNTVKITSGKVAMNIVLPDGSHVTLEPDSKMSYPRDFMASRSVKLEGEALFSVTSADELSEPASGGFSVNAGAITVNVRGTEFSVEYTRESEEASVSLYEGIVDVEIEGNEEVFSMRPGQQLTYSKDAAEPSITEIAVSKMMNMGFTPQLVFDYAPIADILRSIEVNFGVPVKVKESELSDIRLSINLEEETLESSLMYLSFLDNRHDYLLHNGAVVMVKKSDVPEQ